MPEASEVKLTAGYLSSVLENKVITDWVILSGQYENTYPVGFKKFERSLPLLVESVKCKGKLIYFTLFNENTRFYIIHSLRMTGRWQNYEDDFCRWFIEIENNEHIWFRNPRCLATIEFTDNEAFLQKELNKLGPDILTDDFNLPTWKKLVKLYKNKNITSFLMSQNIMSGIGNYIKAEALYYAKISPLRKTGSLKEYESCKLFEGVRIIPRIAYNKGGLSIRDYSDAVGEKGKFETELQIYGKSNAVKTKTSDGRVTHWNPKVQI